MTFAHFRAPLALSLGAIPGALSRYYLGGWLSELTGLENFPIGTMGINLLGCFLMGRRRKSYRLPESPPRPTAAAVAI
jgi:fluoride ion exporter CrcB/FEX